MTLSEFQMADVNLKTGQGSELDEACCDEPSHGGAARRQGAPPKELFNVLTPPDAYARLEAHLPRSVRTERIRTAEALGRVLAEDLTSPSDLPSFPRSTM